MNALPKPARTYSPDNEAQTRRAIEEADRFNHKRGQDLEIAGAERLIMTDTVTGQRGVLSVASGVLTWTILP
jgi:hypothetical protein